ncbi:2429_t:CDS:2 [Funneliformis caledonium]|uniref:2429_t:CDS:1 n=2 Tax=Funneliformis TaxID=1117308 RepID=A0A9N8YNC4_9GLOM|nr:2429_t:CDS:2 [Funneliformis caledonium]CAG8602538.1 10051_t:CDS:2 [Funneliformis mosseae]
MTSSTAVVELGFAEPPESPLLAKNFPNKIGGKPLYTPEDYPPEAFHRTIYVFCCKDGSCHEISWEKSFKVFRSQLPKNNPYWQENESDKKFLPAKQCTVCGLLGSKMCGKCNTVNYCSKEHQVHHWTLGQHKIHCNTTSKPPASLQTIAEHDNHCRKLVLFPEFEALVPVGDEVYENTEVDVDKSFLKFQKRIEQYPDQILRYNRLEYGCEKNAEPLWVSNIGKPTVKDIPSCPYCGQERTFEFQILSTLLNYLEIDHLQRGSLDWGTLLVYSCKVNCHVENMYYINEILWRQDFSEEGVKGLK